MKPRTQEEDSVARLVTLLGLMHKARASVDPVAFSFLAVNETYLLAPFRQAVLWRAYHPSGSCSGGYVEAISGLAVPDHDAPYVLWLSRVLEHLSHISCTPADLQEGGEEGPFASGDASAASLLLSRDQAHHVLPVPLGEAWHDWLPPYAIWLPLTRRQDAKPTTVFFGGLFLVREAPWSSEDRQLLEELAGTYALVWQHLLARRGFLMRFEALFFGHSWRSGRVVGWLLVVLALASLALPVRQSVLAPAVVIAADPVFVRSPLAGIVDRFHVAPNEEVTRDQLLLSLEDTQLRNQLATARKEQEVASAEFRQAVQKATRDPRGKAQSIIEQKRLEQKKADVAFLLDRLRLVDIRAARYGIAVFADTNDWIGRPVKLGERILMLADPKQVALEIHLPVADAINLAVGAEVAMFLNIHPGAPLPAVLEYASYQAEVTAEGILAYRVKARFSDPDRTPRIGLSGFARIYHRRISLFQLLTRRPMATIRRWFGGGFF